MVNMADDKELQKRYIQIYLLKEQFKAMAEEKNALENRVSEMLVSIDTLSKLDSVKRGEEIWSTIGSGAFLRSDIKDIDNVLIGAGAGVVIKKDRRHAIEILKSRIEELVKVDSEMTAEMEKYKQQISRLEEQLQALEKKK